MTNEDRKLILDQFREGAYQLIRQRGLHKELENSEWDSIADLFAAHLFVACDDLVHEQLNTIDAEKQAKYDSATKRLDDPRLVGVV